MKKIITLLSVFVVLASYGTHAQVFWAETFDGSPTAAGTDVTAYSSINGAWSMTVTGTEDADFNNWFVSCKEAGHLTGICGSTCTSGSTHSSSTGATLHVGGNTTGLAAAGDAGASYNAGGICPFACVTTDRRAESPTINCTGKTSITLSFYYIENGDGTNDDATIYYYDGSTWSLLVNTPKTSVCTSPSAGQGQWARYSIALPASANNNANVKIGFRWVNDDDGTGTDPSFAVDSIALSTPGTTSAVTASFTASATTICQDSCVTFTSTSTGTIDSMRWSIPGFIGSTPTTSPATICFTVAGTFTVKLKVYSGSSSDSATTTITVNPAPHPTITQSGHTLSVSGSYTSYQWVNGITPISGATTNSYTYTTDGMYTVVVDSGGCYGISNTINTLGVTNVSGSALQYYISQAGNDAFVLHATDVLPANVLVDIYDATGRKLIEDNWSAGTNKKEFTISGLANGLYIIRLGNSGSSAVLKWMKQ